MAEQSDYIDRFITSHRVPEDGRKHFESIEWTNNFLTNPDYRAIPTFARVLKSSGEDYFFSRTISSPSTIPYMITLQAADFHKISLSPKGTLKGKSNPKDVTPVPKIPDCVTLMALGRPGLDGHPQVIHGGMACAILDETMGYCIMLHQHHSGGRDSLFTVNLNINFRQPVPTPGEVFVRTWVVGREGRKWLSRGQICDKDGQVLTEAEGTWVVVKSQEKL